MSYIICHISCIIYHIYIHTYIYSSLYPYYIYIYIYIYAYTYSCSQYPHESTQLNISLFTSTHTTWHVLISTRPLYWSPQCGLSQASATGAEQLQQLRVCHIITAELFVSGRLWGWDFCALFKYLFVEIETSPAQNCRAKHFGKATFQRISVHGCQVHPASQIPRGRERPGHFSPTLNRWFAKLSASAKRCCCWCSRRTGSWLATSFNPKILDHWF